jgi:NDP-sugar pyrophosphorylase family protein
VAILAGGLATRLRPLTEKIPKVLLEVGGRPFLEHQLGNLRAHGIREIVLCLGFLGEAVQERFGDGADYGVDLHYSFDGPILLGTGGAIRRALPQLGEAFFVLYGDSYLQIDFAAVSNAFFQSRRNGLMTVFKNENSWEASNVVFSNGAIRAYDKCRRTADMRHVDYGLSVFRSSVFGAYPDGASFDLSDVMKDMASNGEMAAYEATQRFYEIGSRAGLAELDLALAGR